MNKYFKKAGNLDENYFRSASDLGEPSVIDNIRDENKYFHPAGDLKVTNVNSNIDDYLLSVVSGEKYDSELVVGAGRIITDINRLKQMVDEGYNIVSAKCLHPTGSMIEVEFQKIRKDNNMGRGR